MDNTHSEFREKKHITGFVPISLSREIFDHASIKGFHVLKRQSLPRLSIPKQAQSIAVFCLSLTRRST